VPVIHVYTPEGFLSPARKRLMVEKVTAAAVEAEGLPTTDRTHVLVHEVPDGGWGWQGETIERRQFERVLPPDPEPDATTPVPLQRTIDR
jgi:4-oxalocrotonate tautomerase family enzyme